MSYLRPSIPKSGRPHVEVLRELEALRANDTDWRRGRVFALVYHAGDEHETFLHRSHALYASTNALNPLAFKSLKQMETEVIGMVASLFNGPPTTVGAMTSGGTESILVAVQTYRDRARAERPHIRRPEIVLPMSAHPAFDKAAHYFDVTLRKVPLDANHRVDVKKMQQAISRRTIALVVSAPQYPHGMIDPIAEIGALAQRKRLPLHVDACVGGFVLPWVERLGRPVPTWDFRVPGVTSISADLHKYGYAAKGASVLMWRSMEYMRHQFTIATDWVGGVYASPSIAGTRPGGPIASAWATLQAIGEDGYLALTKKTLDAADRLRRGIAAIPGLQIVGGDSGVIVTWGAAREAGVDVYAIADRLEAEGWTVERQQRPATIHLTVTQNHAVIVDDYLDALRRAAAEVRANPSLGKSGTAPMYGMIAKVPLRGLVKSSVRKMMEQMYAPGALGPDLSGPPKSEGVVGRIVDRLAPHATELLDKAEAARDRLKARLRRDR